MKYFAATIALVSIVPSILGLTINTPSSVVQCQPILLSWTGGTQPYFLSILPGGQPAAPALKSFSPTSSTSVTWIVDIAGGSPITISLKDSTGAIAFSDIVTIQGSSDSSCVNASVQASASGASSPTAGNTATTAVASTTGAAVGTTRPSSATASGSKTNSGAPASATSAKANAASRASVATLGLAGLAGLISFVVL